MISLTALLDDIPLEIWDDLPEPIFMVLLDRYKELWEETGDVPPLAFRKSVIQRLARKMAN